LQKEKAAVFFET